jgi:ECF transporter S component (folate family)
LKTRFTTQMLTRMAILIALTIILSRIFSIRIPMGGAEGLRIGFGPLPVIFAGIFMGPLAGGIVGAIGDLIGYFINPMGPFLPHFTLTAALRGIIPGLVIFLASRNRRAVGIPSLFAATLITLIIVDIFLLPYFMEILYGLSRVVTIPPRIIQQVITIPVYTVLLYTLGRIMQKTQGTEILHVSAKVW